MWGLRASGRQLASRWVAPLVAPLALVAACRASPDRAPALADPTLGAGEEPIADASVTIVDAGAGADGAAGDDASADTSVDDGASADDGGLLGSRDAASEDTPTDAGGDADAQTTFQKSCMQKHSAVGTYQGPVFTDVTAAAGIQSVYRDPNSSPFCSGVPGGCGTEARSMGGGVAVADYDGDGDEDVFLTRLDDTNLLYRNDGDGTFTDVSAGSGLAVAIHGDGAAWGDIDGDGDLDLFVGTIGGFRFYLFVNDGTGHFTEEAIARGVDDEDGIVHTTFGVTMGDYDGDGWLDVHTTEWDEPVQGMPPRVGHARLFHNRGAADPGHFDDVTAAAGVELATSSPFVFNGQAIQPLAFTSTFSDLDGDGHVDLAVASDFGTSMVFWNRGDGTFENGTASAGLVADTSGMGSTIGDIDGDGRLDWFISGIAESKCSPPFNGNRLYRNLGGRHFTPLADTFGVSNAGWAWGTRMFDFDDDGDLDLAVTNGVSLPGIPPDHVADTTRLFRNDGAQMTAVGSKTGLAQAILGKGLVAFDYDDDGDLDVLVVSNVQPARLFRNDGGNANGWLRVRLAGHPPNVRGIGAVVTVTPVAGGASMVRELAAASSFVGQASAVAHFGLGPGTANVAHVEVKWPSGVVQTLDDVARDQTLVVNEP